LGLIVPLAVCLAGGVNASRPTDRAALDDLARRHRAHLDAGQGAAYRRLLAASEAARASGRGVEASPVLVDRSGVPRFHVTDNLTAAATVNTDDVWPGGSTGFGLTGAGTAPGELGEWDGGGVRTTHQEFGGRAVQMDVPAGLSSHSTHVAGTLIAAGVSAAAKGMSYAGTLAAYEWTDDVAEMATAAANGMLASNHSYGFATGWLFNLDGSGNWFWLGDTTVSAVEDYGFGYYDSTSYFWDRTAFEAPNYLIVKSAGNDRSNVGPAQPDSHLVWAAGLQDWVWSMTVRNPDGAPDGYDTVPWHGCAKNILTVGAVGDIPAGWTGPADVVMSSFSGWGPTDDGRIKPDLVANGVGLISCSSSGDASYASLSGTSMASPNAAGSVNLLSHHYRDTHGGATPRAATMKAVVLHTANEAGAAAGPDYRFGWGLLDVAAAAEVVAADTADRIREETLADGETDEFVVQHPGGTLRVTIAWTDPPAAPLAPALDAPDARLVNDLDLRVEEVTSSFVHEPWVLNPANPAAAATTGDNVRDNVEQVVVAGAAGEYRVRVGHKGALAGGAQDYSIVASGELGPSGLVGVAGRAGAAAFALLGASPNPSGGPTRFDFALAARGEVAFDVLDLSGRRVRSLGRHVFGPGRHGLEWDGRAHDGASLPAGVYFVRGEANGAVRVTRLAIVE
jgi:hypothetical protein